MKKPKKKSFRFPKPRPAIPPTPEQRLVTLQVERDDLVHLAAQRRALGDFDANSQTIRETLQASIDIIDYLISLNERDARGKNRKIPKA